MPEPVAPPRSTAEALRVELAPTGILPRFLVDQTALAMDRLTRAAASEGCDEPAAMRLQAQAERTFRKAMAEYRRQVKAGAKAATPPTPKIVAAPRPVVAAGAGWPSRSRLVDVIAAPTGPARACAGRGGARR